MSIKENIFGKERELMPDIAFHIMSFMIDIHEHFSHYSERLENFDIKNGSTIIDYGCGPGRYITKASQIVGNEGMVYACDIHPLAIKHVKKVISKNKLSNVKPILVKGYSCDLNDEVADSILVLDTFHMIKEPSIFLKEIHRLLKKNGTLIIDDGHQPREQTIAKIGNSSLWDIIEETDDYLKCIPIFQNIQTY